MVMFSAPANEIDAWAGVPQKRQLGERETTGFQREVNPKRLQSLKEFYSDPSNVVQNPLLCASREAAQGGAAFTPDPGQPANYSQTGTLKIEVEELEKWTLLQLLRAVKADIEHRAPHLANQPIPAELIVNLKSSLTDQSVEGNEGEEIDANGVSPVTSTEDSSEADDSGTQDEQSVPAEVIFDESHILEFWQDLAARIKVLEELGDESRDEIQKFSKDAMISFLRPLVVVDGQHRLKGAVETAKGIISEEPYLTKIEKDIEQGASPDDVQLKYETEASRVLPISLLLNARPAEHVFQFVVVNQKATPIGRALLGTIVSTSLSDAELETVSKRLMAAGIPLEESRAAAYVARAPQSPFSGLVERGFASENADVLPWSVLVSLVKIFRELKGGKLFHEKANDYAAIWHTRHLPTSSIVADWTEKGFDSEFAYWRSLAGPWREVFINFWSSVRDKLAKQNDDQAWHYWGSPRRSNIFNKPSLTILSADFFNFLCDSKSTIDDAEAVKSLVDDWLTGVDPDYFNRDWKLQNTKKDSPGIRKTWSQVWLEYRKNPDRLPRTEQYRKSAF